MKRQSKLFISLIASVLICGSMLTGCTQNTPNSDTNQGTIELPLVHENTIHNLTDVPTSVIDFIDDEKRNEFLSEIVSSVASYNATAANLEMKFYLKSDEILVLIKSDLGEEEIAIKIIENPNKPKEEVTESNGDEMPELYSTDYFNQNSKNIIEIDDILKLENNSNPYFVYFFMPSCGACKGVSSEILKLVNDNSIASTGNIYFVDMTKQENRWLWAKDENEGVRGSNISIELEKLKVKGTPTIVKVNSDGSLLASVGTTPCINLIKGK